MPIVGLIVYTSYIIIILVTHKVIVKSNKKYDIINTVQYKLNKQTQLIAFAIAK